MVEVEIEVECPFCGQETTKEIDVEATFECEEQLDGGGTCTRDVDRPGETCWQHSDND